MISPLASLAERLNGGSAIHRAELEAAVSAASVLEQEEALAELERSDWLAAAPLRHALQRARAARGDASLGADETRAVGLGEEALDPGAATCALAAGTGGETRATSPAGGAPLRWIPAADPEAFDPEPPERDRIGPYRVARRLGSGGMGAVFEVEDGQGRRLALKTILAPRGGLLEAARQRFAREAELGARLRHVGIQHVIGGDLEGEQPYLVVELCEGGSLSERLREGPLALEEVRRVGIQLARALGHAHERGVVHRDLKPDNVLFRADGSVALIDFGLAVSLNPDTLRLTSEDMLLGTPMYMSPEQARLGSSDDPAIDLYGLGGLLYVMLSGQPPLDLRGVASLAEALGAVCHRRPRPLRELRPEVPAELEALAARLLEKDPARRPSLLEVERVLAGRGGPAPGLWLALAAGFLLVIGLASLTLAPSQGAGRPTPARTPPPSAGAASPSASLAGTRPANPGPSPASPGASPASPGTSPASPGAGPATGASSPPGGGAPSPGPLLAALREATRRAAWEEALRLADGLSRPSREARFLGAWARFERGSAAGVAELAQGDDRWGLLARTLRDPFPYELGARLSEEHPDCPYAACRGAALAAQGAALREALARSERLLAGPAEGFVQLWLERARLLAAQGEERAAAVCLERARELSGGGALPGAALAEGLLAARRAQPARALELLRAATSLRPGRAHLALGLALEAQGEFGRARLAWAEGAGQAGDALRLAVGGLDDPTRQRLLRYLGLTDLDLPASAEANAARRTRWIEPPELREDARRVVRYAMRGYALRAFEGLLRAVSRALASEPRWLELELRILTTRCQWDAALALVARLERGGSTPRLRFQRAVLESRRSGQPPPAELVEELAGCDDPVVANTVRAARAQDRGEGAAAERFARAALALDPDAPLAALSALAHFDARAARPFLDDRSQRWLTLTDSGPLASSYAALRYVHYYDLERLRAAPRHRLTDALRTLTYPRTYGLHPELGLLAARLALRLPEQDPWRANLGPWLWEVEQELRQVPASRREDGRQRLRLVRGLRRLREGGSEAEVRALWRGASLAPWELEAFAERFGAPFER